MWKIFANNSISTSFKRHLHIKNEAFVNGAWVPAKSGKVFSVMDPSNEKVISTVPDMDVEDVKDAIDAASDAFKTWKDTTAKERTILMRRWYDLMVQNQQDLAEILTEEAGKPIKESIGEVVYGNSFIEWYAEEAKRMYGEVVPSPVRSRELVFTKHPIGVVGLITPWNFPHAMITRKAGAALAAGCTCVIRPAEDTPFTALAIAELAEKAGIPKGVLNVVTSSRANAAPIGQLLCESPTVAGISFTGSTAVGKLLYKQCSKGIKRISLELGGNAPFIVFNDADLEKCLDGAIASKFRNCGQTCVSANRFLIQSGIHDGFVSKLTDRIRHLVMGDGKNEKCNLGPLINRAQIEKVDNIVKDAISKGAKAVIGGKKAVKLGTLFYEPTILTGVTPDMLCYTEEVFGPVVTCVKFETEKEAMDVANRTERGLAGYFYTKDISRAFRVARNLEVGMVGVNEGVISTAEAAFGGIKESGIGREGSRHGLEEFTYIKYLCFGNIDSE